MASYIQQAVEALFGCDEADQISKVQAGAPDMVSLIQGKIREYDLAVENWNDFWLARNQTTYSLKKISEQSFSPAQGGGGYCSGLENHDMWADNDFFSMAVDVLVSHNGGPLTTGADGTAFLISDGLAGILGGYDGATSSIVEWGTGHDFRGGLDANLLDGEVDDACSINVAANDSKCKIGACDLSGSDKELAFKYLKAIVETRNNIKEKQKEINEKLLQPFFDALIECDEEDSTLESLVEAAAKSVQGFVDEACKGAAQAGIECPDDVASDEAAAEIDNIIETDPALKGGTGPASEATTAAAEAKEKSGVRNFKEQCYLLAQMMPLADYKKMQIERHNPKKLPYRLQVPPGEAQSNACLMVQGPPYGFINTLTQPPSQAVFFNMENKDISTLMPMIELFKINTNPSNAAAKEWEQKYEFDSNATKRDLDSLFKDKTKRGFGVGIKSFEFTYEGSNPFAAKKSISAKLSIFANGFDELLIDRGGYSYIELALKTGGTEKMMESAIENLDEEFGEIEDALEASEYNKQLRKIKANLKKLDFRLKAVVGWAMPNGNLSHFGSGGFLQSSGYSQGDLLDGINDSFMTLNLTPTTHEFDIDQQGRVNFTIHYLAYVDDYFDQPNFNIFSNIDISMRVRKRALKYKTLGRTCKASEVAAVKEGDLKDKAVKRDKEESLMTIIEQLISRKKMRHINIPYKELIEFQAVGPFAAGSFEHVAQAPPSTLKELKDLYKTRDKLSTEDDPEEIFKLSKNANREGYNNISFFYVSDLIDIILEGIEINLRDMPEKLRTDDTIKKSIAAGEISINDAVEEAQKIEKFYLNYKKFRLLLGPVEIVDPKGNGKTSFVNFGDIPVSSRYFAEWMTEKLIKKDQATYPLTRFLTDFFNTLIRDFLNSDECFQGQLKQKTRLNQAVITSYNNDEQDQHDEITEYTISPHNNGSLRYTMAPGKWPSRMHVLTAPRPILNIFGSRDSPISNPGSDREINYLTFFAGRTQPTELMRGNRSEDEQRGIFHYLLGKNRGIVKTIELSKTDSKFLKELRFEQEGYLGLEQLREIYDINATTYANVHTFPGTYIFVDPRGFAPNSIINGESFDLTQFGIGGYCMIIRSTHTFGPGTAETSITAKWVASIDGTGTAQIPPTKDEGETETAVDRSHYVEKYCSDIAGAAAAERAAGSVDLGFLAGIVDFDMEAVGEFFDDLAKKFEGATGIDVPMIGD